MGMGPDSLEVQRFAAEAFIRDQGAAIAMIETLSEIDMRAMLVSMAENESTGASVYLRIERIDTADDCDDLSEDRMREIIVAMVRPASGYLRDVERAERDVRVGRYRGRMTSRDRGFFAFHSATDICPPERVGR